MAAPSLEALMAALPLAELPRTGWLQIGLPPGIPPETIAAHASLVAQLVLRLGREVAAPFDLYRAAAIATAHDAAEARLGDLPKDAAGALPEGAKRSAEEAIEAHFFPELADLCAEYRSQATPEARFVKLADKLQMGLVALRLRRAGHLGLAGFASTLAELDCAEFQGLARLQAELLIELKRDGLTKL